MLSVAVDCGRVLGSSWLIAATLSVSSGLIPSEWVVPPPKFLVTLFPALPAVTSNCFLERLQQKCGSRRD